MLRVPAAMCLRTYTPRAPEAGQLHRLVREHRPSFAVRLEEADRRLPGHVMREMESFLECGVLAYGFVRVRCPGCAEERLVGFSCKGRGFCPSCGARRMSSVAAHLVDEVLPRVPMRQWVLSLPRRLRWRLAYSAERTGAVLAVVMRTLLTWIRRRTGQDAGRGGAVSLTQRFGSALSLNVHFHLLVVDGVFSDEADGLRFHRLPGFDGMDLAELEQTIAARVLSLMRRRGWLAEDELGEDAADAQGEAGGASIQGRVAFGPRRGRRVRRLGSLPRHLLDDDEGEEARVRPQGFSLYAGPPVDGSDRRGLERLVRYMARSSVCVDRLSQRADGLYAYRLARPWRDGTTHVVFSASELLEKLVALVPPRRMHLLRYHGVLAPAAAWRRQVIPPTAPSARRGAPASRSSSGLPSRWIPWVELMRRVHALDVLECPRCGGRMEILAYLTQPSVVEAILAARGLPTQPPPRGPARRSLELDL